MKIRMFALAGTCLLALTLAAAAQESGGATSGGATSSGTSAPPMQPPPPPPPPPPAPAPVAETMTQGWYFGAAAGYDRMGNAEEVSASGNRKFNTDSTALIDATFGYRFANRLRVEEEIGWDEHNLNNAVLLGPEVFSGHISTLSILLNVAYDFPLSKNWDFTVGAGAGIGDASMKATGNLAPKPDFTSGTHQGYMWQAFTGFDYWVSRDVSVNLDWRYRELAENKNYTFDNFLPYKLKGLHEQALMLSVRWYPSWFH